jgi:hypothetical protein
LTADQKKDSNIDPEKLEGNDMLVIPVLLSSFSSLGDTKELWTKVQPEEGDRKMDISSADNVVAYPLDNPAWETYLKSEIETASGQGFDVLDKGFTIVVKKNGRIMKRATGIPVSCDVLLCGVWCVCLYS